MTCRESDLPARLGWFRGPRWSFHDVFAGPWISFWNHQLLLRIEYSRIDQKKQHLKTCPKKIQVASKIQVSSLNSAKMGKIARDRPTRRSASKLICGCQVGEVCYWDWAKNIGIIMGVSWDIHEDIMEKPSNDSNDFIWLNLIMTSGRFPSLEWWWMYRGIIPEMAPLFS